MAFHLQIAAPIGGAEVSLSLSLSMHAVLLGTCCCRERLHSCLVSLEDGYHCTR